MTAIQQVHALVDSFEVFDLWDSLSMECITTDINESLREADAIDAEYSRNLDTIYSYRSSVLLYYPATVKIDPKYEYTEKELEYLNIIQEIRTIRIEPVLERLRRKLRYFTDRSGVNLLESNYL